MFLKTYMAQTLQMLLVIFSGASLPLPLGKLQISSSFQKTDVCWAFTLAVSGNCLPLNHSQIKKLLKRLLQ